MCNKKLKLIKIVTTLLIIILFPSSVFGACMMFDNGICATVKIDNDGSFLNINGRMADTGDFFDSIHIGEDFATYGYIRTTMKNTRHLDYTLHYNQVCEVTDNGESLSFACVSQDEPDDDNACVSVNYGKSGMSNDPGNNWFSWTVNGEDSNLCRMFGRVRTRDTLVGGACFPETQLSVNSYCGSTSTCENLDSDGDGLAEDCPDTTRSCFDNVLNCFGVKWDDPECEAVPVDGSILLVPRCANICIDEDEDHACSIESLNARRITDDSDDIYENIIPRALDDEEELPEWFRTQAHKLYESTQLGGSDRVSAHGEVKSDDERCLSIAQDPACCTPPLDNGLPGCTDSDLPEPGQIICRYCDVVEDYEGFNSDDLLHDDDYSFDDYSASETDEWVREGLMLDVFDCNDEDPYISPFIDESSLDNPCNLVDDDCDGFIDECPMYTPIGYDPSVSDEEIPFTMLFGGIVVGLEDYFGESSSSDTSSGYLDGMRCEDLVHGNDFVLPFYAGVPSGALFCGDDIFYIKVLRGSDGTIEVYEGSSGRSFDDLISDVEIIAHYELFDTSGFDYCSNDDYSSMRCCIFENVDGYYEYYWSPVNEDENCYFQEDSVFSGICDEGLCIENLDYDIPEYEESGITQSLGTYLESGEEHTHPGPSTPQQMQCVYREDRGCRILDWDDDGFGNIEYGCPECFDCNDETEDIGPAVDDNPTDNPGEDDNCNNEVDEMVDSDSDERIDMFDECNVGKTVDNEIIDYKGCWYSTDHDNLPTWE